MKAFDDFTKEDTTLKASIAALKNELEGLEGEEKKAK